MLASAFDGMAPLMRQHCHERSAFRVHHEFREVDILISLHNRVKPGREAFPDADAGEAEIEQYFEAGREADALHRAVIEAAHRAATVLLHECAGRPGREMNVAKLLTTSRAKHLRSRTAWLGLYCLGVFRNKVVTHQEVPRRLSTLTDADDTRWLVPLPEDFHLDRRDAARIREIRDTTGLSTGTDNDFDLLESLFYSAPVTFGGPPSTVRREIDDIAERGGVKSPSVNEVNLWLAGAIEDIPILVEGP